MNDDEQAARLRQFVSDTIDANSGMIWRSNEQAWQDVSSVMPPGITAHCLQVVYVTADDGTGEAQIGGCAVSAPPDLSAQNVAFILMTALENLQRIQIKNVDGRPVTKLS